MEVNKNCFIQSCDPHTQSNSQKSATRENFNHTNVFTSKTTIEQEKQKVEEQIRILEQKLSPSTQIHYHQQLHGTIKTTPNIQHEIKDNVAQGSRCYCRSIYLGSQITENTKFQPSCCHRNVPLTKQSYHQSRLNPYELLCAQNYQCIDLPEVQAASKKIQNSIPECKCCQQYDRSHNDSQTSEYVSRDTKNCTQIFQSQNSAETLQKTLRKQQEISETVKLLAEKINELSSKNEFNSNSQKLNSQNKNTFYQNVRTEHIKDISSIQAQENEFSERQNTFGKNWYDSHQPQRGEDFGKFDKQSLAEPSHNRQSGPLQKITAFNIQGIPKDGSQHQKMRAQKYHTEQVGQYDIINEKSYRKIKSAKRLSSSTSKSNLKAKSKQKRKAQKKSLNSDCGSEYLFNFADCSRQKNGVSNPKPKIKLSQMKSPSKITQKSHLSSYNWQEEYCGSACQRICPVHSDLKIKKTNKGKRRDMKSPQKQIYQDAQFRNRKHQKDHLLQSFKQQDIARNNLIDKILKINGQTERMKSKSRTKFECFV